MAENYCSLCYIPLETNSVVRYYGQCFAHTRCVKNKSIKPEVWSAEISFSDLREEVLRGERLIASFHSSVWAAKRKSDPEPRATIPVPTVKFDPKLLGSGASVAVGTRNIRTWADFRSALQPADLGSKPLADRMKNVEITTTDTPTREGLSLATPVKGEVTCLLCGVCIVRYESNESPEAWTARLQAIYTTHRMTCVPPTGVRTKVDLGSGAIVASSPAPLQLAADRAFRLLAGLDLRDHSLAEQREVVEVVRELGRALKPVK